MPIIPAVSTSFASLVEEIKHLAQQGNPLVALLGGGGSRGRRSLLGLAQKIREYDATQDASHEFCPYPLGTRVILMGYEYGARFVELDPVASPGGQPALVAFDIPAPSIFEHADNVDPGLRPLQDNASARTFSLQATVSDQEHARRIQQTHQHIRAGDIYQANVSRRLMLREPIHGLAFALQLARDNPVPHGAYLQWNSFELISNSMETLLTFDASTRRVASYPIKGTAAQHTHKHARQQQRALHLDPKERAEHVMIVDLVRNDLGRISVPNSVNVHPFMAIEGYRGVWHGVSAVSATARSDTHLAAIVAAVFPGGSITGAPKRRAVEILRSIEEEPRGFYTGSLGVIWPDGSASFSILIRTMVQDARGRSLNVGGGIVADSTPAREIVEMSEKVAVFERNLAAMHKASELAA